MSERERARELYYELSRIGVQGVARARTPHEAADMTMSERVHGLFLCLSHVMSLGPARLLSFWCGSREVELLKEKGERAKECQNHDEQLRKVDILKSLLLCAFLLSVY